MKVNLGILFAFWLKDNKGLDYDSYVEKYKTNISFRNEVNNQEDINEYREVKNEQSSKELEALNRIFNGMSNNVGYIKYFETLDKPSPN